MIGSSEVSSNVIVTSGGVRLDGLLNLPEASSALVVFAHGSGSGRFSPRNQVVATALYKSGISSLLVDLLTRSEQAVDAVTFKHRFDIRLLGERLTGAVDWAVHEPVTLSMKIGLYGASTGGGAAMITASRRRSLVAAVVSRGGRPDLSWEALDHVLAPTLLIVGGDDADVIEMNRRASARLNCIHDLILIPGATHLFEEPGKMDEVATYTVDWLKRYL